MIYSVEKETAISVVQITDCHLLNNRHALLFGVNPFNTLQEVIADINNKNHEDTTDLVLVTGDNTHDGDMPAYQLLLEQLNELPAPFFWLPGNHDDPTVMAAACNDNRLRCKHILTPHWQIFLLDSGVTNEIHGTLSAGELDWLTSAWQTYPQKFTAVFLHHQLLPVGSAFIDDVCVKNADEVLELLDQIPQLRIVCNGHVHQCFQQTRAHYTVLSTPSTFIQFKPNCETHINENSPPAYRRFTLHNDGNFETEVVSVG